MELTTEFMATLYSRVNQYAITKFGTEPNRIRLCEDGTFDCKWTHYGRCGDDDHEYETVTVEELSEDLDVVIAQRLQKEEEERIKRKLQQEEENRKREQREKDERRKQYNNLRKEFENQ